MKPTEAKLELDFPFGCSEHANHVFKTRVLTVSQKGYECDDGKWIRDGEKLITECVLCGYPRDISVRGGVWRYNVSIKLDYLLRLWAS